MIGDDLRSMLADDADVSAKVGGRVYKTAVPQGAALPFVVLQQITGGDSYHLAGTDDLAETTYQITAFAESTTAAEQIAATIRDKLGGRTLPLGDEGLEYITLTSERNASIAPGDGSQRGVAGVEMDFRIHYRRPAPAG